jgi:3-oxoadipate enol-lactonase
MHFQYGDSTLFYRDEGAGEPILFVHGFPLSGELWEPVLPHLGEHWRRIVPDLRGLGRSEPAERTSMESYAADLAALLDHLGEDRPVVLVGLSMGGYVGFEFARRYPTRLRALVLANTRAAADSEQGAAARHETADRVIREGSHTVADAMSEKLFSPAAPQELRAHWRQVMAASPPDGVAAALRAMALRPDSFETLRTAGLPVLVVAGADDSIVPLAEAESMRDAAPGSVLEVIHGAGHMTPVEQPSRFVAVLRKFLSGLPPLDR